MAPALGKHPGGEPCRHMGIGIPNLLSSDEADVQIAGLLQHGGSDLVHPTGEAYSLLAERLLAKLAEAVKKPVEKKSLEAPPGSKKRKRSPSCDRRPSWVSENITEVGRRQAGSYGSAGRQGAAGMQRCREYMRKLDGLKYFLPIPA